MFDLSSHLYAPRSVDADKAGILARLKGEADGLFHPINSKVLDDFLYAIIDVYVNVTYSGALMEIKGKVFIVTGGASGLGEGTARMLAANGGKVVIADMQAEKGEAIAKEIGGAFVKCDVSQEADGQAVVAKAVSLGKLMGLVNCAGIAPAEKTVGKNGAHIHWACTPRPSWSTWSAAST